jgi:hypothetical protein
VAPARQRAVQLAGASLRRRIWDPLSASGDGATMVLVVPDGSLHLVDFGALPDPKSPARFLLERGR